MVSPLLGSSFAELVELPDVVFDLAITNNRPDAMSLVGIARDLAAHYEIEYRIPDRPLRPCPGRRTISVAIEDPAGCRRFTAREIRGVEVGSSPLWVRHRLRKAGMRAISNIVDVTNYVMLELGHPLHAFDADTISGNRLTVKRADAGETLETLDGEQRTLSADDLIIYDADGPTSMSGTMGGARSEVSESTVNVLMEAASWDPPTIMYMSRRHGLMSEASTRFERGVDPNLTDEANARAAAMVVELGGGGVLEDVIDEIAVETQPVEVDLTLADVERLLGPGFTTDQVSGILTRLGMTVDGTDPMVVTVPTFRPDVTRPADLVEEVARLHGYEQFGATLPTGPGGGLTLEQKRARRLTSALVGLGMHQTVTLPFVNQADLANLGWTRHGLDCLTVSNPLREEEGHDAADHAPRIAQRRPSQLLIWDVGGRALRDGACVPGRARVGGSPPPATETTLAWVIVGGVGPHLLGQENPVADARVSLSVLRHVMAVLGHLEFEVEPADAARLSPGPLGRGAARRVDHRSCRGAEPSCQPELRNTGQGGDRRARPRAPPGPGRPGDRCLSVGVPTRRLRPLVSHAGRSRRRSIDRSHHRTPAPIWWSRPASSTCSSGQGSTRGVGLWRFATGCARQTTPSPTKRCRRSARA